MSPYCCCDATCCNFSAGQRMSPYCRCDATYCDFSAGQRMSPYFCCDAHAVIFQQDSVCSHTAAVTQRAVIFQQDNLCPHTAAAMHPALRGVQQLPWLARAPDLSPIERVRDMMKWELTLSPEPATTFAGFASTGTICLGRSTAG